MSRNVPSALVPVLYKLYSSPLQIIELYATSPYVSPSHFYVANSSDIEFPTGGQVYTAIAAKRSPIKHEDGTIIQEINVQLDNIDFEFRSLISSGVLNRKKCVIKVVFDGYLGNANNYITLFSGYLDNPTGDNRWLSLTIKPFSLLEREYPRRVYQIGCNWTFCDDQCGLTITDYDANLTTIAGSDKTTLVFADSGHTNNYFVPGYVEITSGDLLGEIKPIASSTSENIILRVPLSIDPAVGVTFKAQKLCSKNPTSCDEDFDNYLNYGGFPHVPLQVRL